MKYHLVNITEMECEEQFLTIFNMLLNVVMSLCIFLDVWIIVLVKNFNDLRGPIAGRRKEFHVLG